MAIKTAHRTGCAIDSTNGKTSVLDNSMQLLVCRSREGQGWSMLMVMKKQKFWSGGIMEQ